MERLASPRSATGGLLIAAAYSLIALLPIGPRGTDPGLTIASGLVMAVAIVWVAVGMQKDRRTQFVVWFTLVFLNLAAAAIEGTLFAPELAPSALLAASLTRLLVASVAIGAIAATFFGLTESNRSTVVSRPLYDWLWRLLVAAGVYVALYFVIGGINYTLITRPYYESHAASLTVPPAQTVLLFEPIRGLLIALSVLPLILALRMRTRTMAATAGLMLFIAGGLVPLLPQTSLPVYLRVASLWEIFGQNFFTGVACALLFASPFQRSTEAPAPAGSLGGRTSRLTDS